MTRKDILKKYGYRYMSGVNLTEKISRAEAMKFERLVKNLSDHHRGPTPPEEWWKKRMYNQFMKGTSR